jgi:hypothetical protein
MQDILRSVLTAIITRDRGFTDRYHKYRPRIDRLEMSRSAGLSPPRYLWRSVRAVFWPALLIAYDRSPSVLLPGQTDSWRSATHGWGLPEG